MITKLQIARSQACAPCEWKVHSLKKLECPCVKTFNYWHAWVPNENTRLATCPHTDNYQMEPVQTPMAPNQLVSVTLIYEWVTYDCQSVRGETCNMRETVTKTNWEKEHWGNWINTGVSRPLKQFDPYLLRCETWSHPGNIIRMP